MMFHNGQEDSDFTMDTKAEKMSCWTRKCMFCRLDHNDQGKEKNVSETKAANTDPRKPQFIVTVDIVLFAAMEGTIKVLLIKRGHEPFKDCWALPGGFVDVGEDLKDAARRELKEETGLAEVSLGQLGAYGAPGRDPRGPGITVAYVGAANAVQIKNVKAGDDAAEAKWVPVTEAHSMAFDHAEILKDAYKAIMSTLKDALLSAFGV